MPRQWKVVQHVREKFTCRNCDQPLNRQSERYGREGVDLSVSTLADQVGGCAVLLRPIHDLICDHVFAGRRVHGGETPVPVQARYKRRKGR